MAETAYVFSKFPLTLGTAKFADLSSAGTAVKVALLTSAASIVQETWDYLDDLNTDNHEVANGNGYTTGGGTLASKTYAEATKVTTFDAADLTWSASTITARYAVIYYSTGTAATSPLISYVDFGADKSSSSGNFTISWNASGIFTVTVP